MTSVMSVRIAVAAVAACLVLAAPAAQTAARAATPAVVTAPGSVYFGYLPPVVIVEEGASLTYANFDSAEHDFVQDVEADGFGGPKKAPWCKKAKASAGHDHGHAHGCPVFFTPLLGAGESAEVKGLQNLDPGTSYSFVCTKHHNMRGTLIAR